MKCRICKKPIKLLRRTIYQENSYCDFECFKKTEEYHIFHKKFKHFWKSLSEDQQYEFFNLWDNGIFEDLLFDDMIYKKLSKVFKEHE